MKEKRFELKEVDAYTIKEIKQSFGWCMTPLIDNKRIVEVSVCGEPMRHIKVDFATDSEPVFSITDLEKIFNSPLCYAEDRLFLDFLKDEKKVKEILNE